MADYVSIIAKAVAALAENNAANRQVIYDKARTTIDRKLRALDPVPAESVIAQQLAQLDTAIGQVEAEHLAGEAIAELDSFEPETAYEEDVVGEAPEASWPESEEPVEVPEAEPGPYADPAHWVLPEAADTVLLIDGIGEKTRENLAGEGITRLSEIAAMGDADLAALTERIGIAGFELTQEWKAQAQSLLAGNPPRSKTDQDRLQKLLEEAGGVGGEAEPAAAMAADAGEWPEPAEDRHASEPFVEAAEAPETGDDGAGFAELPQVADDPMPASAPDPVDMAVASEPGADAWLDRPMHEDAPQPEIDDLAAAPQPEFVSELEGDPVADDGYGHRPLAGSAVPPPKRGRGGTAIGWLIVLFVLAGIAAAGWLYRDRVRDVAGAAYRGVMELAAGDEKAPAGGATAQQGQEASSNAPDGGVAAQDGDGKNTARLGSDGQTTEGEPTQLIPPQNGENPMAGEGGGATAGNEEAASGGVGNVAPDATDGVGSDTAEEAGTPPAVVAVDEPQQGGEGTPQAGETGNPDAGAATGEGTADATANGTAANGSGQTTQLAVVAGEKAYLYEEGFGNSGASRDDGAVSWSLVNEPPEEGLPPEPVIRGVVDVPSRGFQLTLSIKRNLDDALSASHIIELLFSVPGDFSGGNVDKVSRFVMKASEEARGESLVGVPVRIDAGYFLLALNNLEQAVRTNVGLLENGAWIDIPVSFLTGRRGLMALEKGVSGDKVFRDALADWKNR